MDSIKIESKADFGLLERVVDHISNATPLMRAIANEFTNQTDENFAEEGRPKWLGLKPSTIARRERQGSWPGRIMQVSGQLAASYSTQHDSASASIGSNKVYAAIQNMGGKAGRGGKVTIEARPQIPIDKNGNLQHEAETAIIGIANQYLRGITG